MINHVTPMAVKKIIVFVLACGVIKLSLFVVSCFIVFPRAVSSFLPATLRLVFIHNIAMDRIIRREINNVLIILRGGKSTKIVLKGKRDGRWNHIWGIMEYLCGIDLSSMVTVC